MWHYSLYVERRIDRMRQSGSTRAQIKKSKITHWRWREKSAQGRWTASKKKKLFPTRLLSLGRCFYFFLHSTCTQTYTLLHRLVICDMQEFSFVSASKLLVFAATPLHSFLSLSPFHNSSLYYVFRRLHRVFFFSFYFFFLPNCFYFSIHSHQFSICFRCSASVCCTPCM